MLDAPTGRKDAEGPRRREGKGRIGLGQNGEARADHAAAVGPLWTAAKRAGFYG